MVDTEYNFLRLVEYKDFSTWATNFYTNRKLITSSFPLIHLSKIIKPRKIRIKNKDYKKDMEIVEKIRFSDGKIFFRSTRTPKNDLFFSEQGDLIVSNINFEKGAFAINTFGDIATSTDYQPYQLMYDIEVSYFNLVLRSEKFLETVKSVKPKGMKTRAKYDFIKEFTIPVPKEKNKQIKIVNKYNNTILSAEKKEAEANELEIGINKLLFDELGMQETGEFSNKTDSYNFINFVKFQDVTQWGVDFIKSNTILKSSLYKSVRISSICEVGSGGTPNRSNTTYFSGNFPWIKTAEVVDEEIFDTEEKITLEAINNSSAKIYPKGSLIIAMYGQGKTRGRTAKLLIDATTNQACAVLYNIDTEKVDVDFLWAYLQGEYNRIRRLAYGNNQPNLNAQMIKDYPVFLPHISIQKELSKKFFDLKSQIKNLRSQAQELRTKAKHDFENAVFNI